MTHAERLDHLDNLAASVRQWLRQWAKPTPCVEHYHTGAVAECDLCALETAMEARA